MTTQDRLKELFEYHSGKLIRRIAVSNIPAGTAAGHKATNGYVIIYVDGRPYKAHRLVWLFHHGKTPKLIDHANGVRSDNRLENLREATPSQNSQNSRRKSKGVGLHCGKWRARIMIEGVSQYLGHFETEQEARDAYARAAQKLQGEFACLSDV